MLQRTESTTERRRLHVKNFAAFASRRFPLVLLLVFFADRRRATSVVECKRI
jgi:hypothetical protein